MPTLCLFGSYVCPLAFLAHEKIGPPFSGPQFKEETAPPSSGRCTDSKALNSPKHCDQCHRNTWPNEYAEVHPGECDQCR